MNAGMQCWGENTKRTALRAWKGTLWRQGLNLRCRLGGAAERGVFITINVFLVVGQGACHGNAGHGAAFVQRY
eukprot:1149834-Pelagomonas_calceolata.AAC.5